jgi:hypothetical protein
LKIDLEEKIETSQKEMSLEYEDIKNKIKKLETENKAKKDHKGDDVDSVYLNNVQIRENMTYVLTQVCWLNYYHLFFFFLSNLIFYQYLILKEFMDSLKSFNEIHKSAF